MKKTPFQITIKVIHGAPESVVSMVLTTELLVAEKKEPKENATPAMPSPGMYYY